MKKLNMILIMMLASIFVNAQSKVTNECKEKFSNDIITFVETFYGRVIEEAGFYDNIIKGIQTNNLKINIDESLTKDIRNIFIDLMNLKKMNITELEKNENQQKLCNLYIRNKDVIIKLEKLKEEFTKLYQNSEVKNYNEEKRNNYDNEEIKKDKERKINKEIDKNNQTINNDKELIHCDIDFDSNWRFLKLRYSDANRKIKTFTSKMNPFTDIDTEKKRSEKVSFTRIIYLTSKNIKDYLNGEVIYPDCEIKKPTIDVYYNGKNYEDKQSIMARIYSMSINIDLTDNLLYEGQSVYFNKNHEIEKELYCRYFDDGYNSTMIYQLKNNDDPDGWIYGYYFKNQFGEYEKLAVVTVSRSSQIFSFYNQKRKLKMIFMVAPSYVKSEMGIINNAVYKFSSEETEKGTPTSYSKYEFFKLFFDDYKKLKLRNLSRAWMIPVNSTDGINNDYIQKYMTERNTSFNETIDQLIYDLFIATYSDFKYYPFKPYKLANGVTEVLCE